MTKSKGRIRFVYRRSSPLLKCVVLATIVLSTAALILLNATTNKEKKELEELRQLAAQLEWSKEDLEMRIGELGTVKGVTRIAGDVLGLVDPDTKFFFPEDNTNSD